jgi:hypothetical protein
MAFSLKGAARFVTRGHCAFGSMTRPSWEEAFERQPAFHISALTTALFAGHADYRASRPSKSAVDPAAEQKTLILHGLGASAQAMPLRYEGPGCSFPTRDTGS